MSSFYSANSFVPEDTTKAIGGCMLALGTVFVVARFAIQTIKQRLSLSEDIPLFVAWACMLAQCTGYILSTPAIYRALAVERGEALSSENSRADETSLRRSLFTNTLLFWTSLWAVKISLLVQARRLIDRRQKRLKAWGFVFGFCVFSYIGCVMSHLTVCGPVNSWFSPSQCRGAQDAHRALISLYFSFSMDVLTNLAILFLALPPILRSKLNQLHKIGMVVLFSLATISICIATVRVAQNGATSQGKYPSPPWLAVWSMIETALVIIVGCLPAFCALAPPRQSTSHPEISPETRKQSELSAMSDAESMARADSMQMMSLRSNLSTKRTTLDSQSHDFRIIASDSNNRIAWGSPGVMVTRTFEIGEPVDRSPSTTGDSPTEREARNVV